VESRSQQIDGPWGANDNRARKFTDDTPSNKVYRHCKSMILRQTKFIIIICASLFCYSQAKAGGEAYVSSETSVTGGTIVGKDTRFIAIRELDTNKLMRFFFIEGIARIEGGDSAGETEVIVDDQTATPDKLKVGMRARVVFYTSVEPSPEGEKTKWMKSVKAISRAKQKPAE
jgi:hypothetical protein